MVNPVRILFALCVSTWWVVASKATDIIDHRIAPLSGPLDGGTVVRIYGHVLEATTNITYQIRFRTFFGGDSFFADVDAEVLMEEHEDHVDPVLRARAPPFSSLATPERANTGGSATVEALVDGQAAVGFFSFYYHVAAPVTAVTPQTVSVFGGNRVTVFGEFKNLYEVPQVKLYAQVEDGAPLSTIASVETVMESDQLYFLMNEIVLPTDSATMWVLLSLNGQDFVNTTFTLTVQKKLDPLKACFMYFNLPDNTPGWTYATNLGKLTLEQELGPSVQAVVAAPVRGADAAKAQSRSFIDQGCRIIIGIHITHRQANSVLLEDKYKNSTVKFVLGGEFARPEEPEVGTCFPKLYETRYLAGMVAGNATRSNVIGYVVSFFIPQTLRQANAFARGVREMNPVAKVVLYASGDWNSDKTDVAAGRLLLRMGADVVTQHTNGLELQNLFHSAGLPTLGVWSNYAATQGDLVLVSAVNLWGPCFIEYTKQVMYDNWRPGQGYFHGVKEGYSGISPFSPRVPLDVQLKVLTARQQFQNGRSLMCGPVYEERGGEILERLPEGECWSNQDIESMELMNYTAPGIEMRGVFQITTCGEGSYNKYHEATFEFVGCERCPNGTFSVTGEELECIACPPGTIGRDGTCAACPPGAFSRNPGSTQCGLCPAGSAQPAEGAAQCEACARGFFSAAPGAAQCEPCSQDSYNPSPNQTQCQHCPPNTAAAFFAATDEGMCRCVEGFYPTSGDGQQCAACPVVRTSVTFAAAAGPKRNCSRMTQCATVEQRSDLVITFTRKLQGAREAAPLCGIDDLRVDDVFVRHIGSDLLANANEKRLELQDSQSEFVNRAVVDREYSATISSNVTVGVFLLELVVNGVPAAESPLIYQVVEVTCEDNQVARLGECVEVTNKSNTFLIILAVVVGCTLLIILALATIYLAYRAQLTSYYNKRLLYRNPPKEGQDLTIVITDIEGSTSLWDRHAEEMNQALAVHDKLLRALMSKHHGYELLTEGDSFLVAFHEASDALAWCAAVQSALYEVPWSSTILQATHHAECPAFRGLRVRMGVHSGVAEKVKVHPNTKRVQYPGKVLAVAKAVEATAHGGQILLSGDALAHLSHTSHEGAHHLVHLGLHQLDVKAAPREHESDASEEDDAPDVALNIEDEQADEKNHVTGLGVDLTKHEIVLVLPLPLKDREMFFEPIKSKAKLSPNYYEAPDYKNVTSLFTYIENANDLKASNPEAFEVALQQHNQAVRQRLLDHNGYECREEGGQFLLAFHSATDAVQFSIALQDDLLRVKWHKEILEQPAACRMVVSGCIIFRGLRVQIGMATGPVLEMKPCQRTGRAEYFGAQLNKAARIANAAWGGQVLAGLCTFNAIDARVMHELTIQVTSLGKYNLKGVAESEQIHQVSLGRMLLRPFPPIKAQKRSWKNKMVVSRGSRNVRVSLDETRPGASEDSFVSSRAHSMASTMSVSLQSDLGLAGLASLEQKLMANVRGTRVCLHVFDKKLCATLKEALGEMECEVLEANASSGPKAVQALISQAVKCQVLVMDADPLERSKFGMLKKMHAAAVEHGVVMPGVVFTHPQAVCKEEALKTPLVADFLTQPLEVDRVELAVGKAARAHQRAVASAARMVGAPGRHSSGDRASQVSGATADAAAARHSKGSMHSVDMSELTRSDSNPEQISDAIVVELLGQAQQVARAPSTRGTRLSYTTVSNSMAAFNNSSERRAMDIFVILGPEALFTPEGELDDPFFIKLKEIAAARGHTIQESSSARDAMRTLDIALAKQTEKDAPEAGAGPGGFLPQLIIVDFRHGHLKGTEELLSKIREYDVSRRSLLVDVVVSLQDDEPPFRRLHDAGADICTRPMDASLTIMQLMHQAEVFSERNSYHMKTRVLFHAMEQLPEAVVMTDVTGAIVWVNSMFEKNTGFKLDEVKGADVDCLENKNYNMVIRQQMVNLIGGSPPWSGIGAAVTRAGEEIFYNMKLSLLLTEEGQPQFFVLIQQDVTRDVVDGKVTPPEPQDTLPPTTGTVLTPVADCGSYYEGGGESHVAGTSDRSPEANEDKSHYSLSAMGSDEDASPEESVVAK